MKTCLDELITSYSSIEKYPLLGLYVTDPLIFSANFIIIEEVDYITICSRNSLEMVTIDKVSLEFDFTDGPLLDIKKNTKSKLFSLGNFELYKKSFQS